MKLIRISVFSLLAGLLIIGASAAAWATPTQSWVVDPATGCKIGWVCEDCTLISASWSGPMVAGKAQGKGNLSLTMKGNDGKEMQSQGQAEMRAGLLNGKVVLKWSDGSSYDGFYKAGLREGKCILRYANGDSYDGYYKADLKEGKGIYKSANGSSYDGDWKNGKMEGHGVLKDATGKIIYQGEYKDGKPVTQAAQPKSISAGAAAGAAQSWVVDPATGCKIGWVHEQSTLISASWSGPMVAGKAQGKGNLSLTIKDKDGKEMQSQGQAEMRAGLLDGKAAIKWLDGDSYDGFYKAGQKEGKGIFKFADGTMYDGEWKNGNMEGRGTFKWPNGEVYDGEFKAGRQEGKGIYKWADGRIYDGEFKAGQREGKGIMKYPDGGIYDGEWKAEKKEGKGIMRWADGAMYDGEFKAGLREGKGIFKFADGRIYDGEWKDDKPVNQSFQPKTEKF